MKAYKRLQNAQKHAGEAPVIKVGDLYIVGADKLTEIAVLRADRCITGWITAGKLDGLGNGNHAKPGNTVGPDAGTAFK